MFSLPRDFPHFFAQPWGRVTISYSNNQYKNYDTYKVVIPGVIIPFLAKTFYFALLLKNCYTPYNFSCNLLSLFICVAVKRLAGNIGLVTCKGR